MIAKIPHYSTRPSGSEAVIDGKVADRLHTSQRRIMVIMTS
jgi:hypothetical protein